MAIPTDVQLSALDGTNGFRIRGAASGDASGRSVTSAGDINGDGIADLIIGAPDADPNGLDSGASYIVYGRVAGFGTNLDLSALDGTNGFRINGVAAGDRSGSSVASAGDINGDGYDDLIIGAPHADVNADGAGATYVVFGRAAAFGGSFELSTLNGANGFRISGAADGDGSGFSVASAGDVNGDGLDDLIIGAQYADPDGDFSGASYVVFGSGGAFGANLNLSALNGINGFRIMGAATGDLSGRAVDSAGDINGDGFDDLVIGAWGADPNGASSGTTHVIFGRAAAFGPDLNLATLNGANGFRIHGVAADDRSGFSVASAGDVNGDGIDDLIIGARGADATVSGSGASYVVFGSTLPFAADLNLSALDGTNGFRIGGASVNDQIGWSVASAGDVNGDGIGDLVIGAPYADPNGSGSGESYVVFGSAAGFAAHLSVSALDGTNGFRIKGGSLFDLSGWSVNAAGDVNGDGLADVIVGARGADVNGGDSGASYVVFGVQGDLTLTGTIGNETLSGKSADDAVFGLGGNDVLYGLAGDDTLDGGDLSDVLNGGDGADGLIGGGGGDVMSGDAGDDLIDGGDGHDKLFGGAGADDLVGGLGNDRFDGGDGIDQLTGGDGNDYLDGGTGEDVMTGGLANDVYIVDDADDQTVEGAGEGYDIVRTALDGWVLAANIEGLELQGGGDIDGSGNALANNLQGNAGANILSGEAGADTLNGNDGDDAIVGGLGNDLLRGGTGADGFVIAHAFGATLETDQVYDFSTAEGDFVDLSDIDAIAGGADDPFTLVAGFTKAAGQMTLSFFGGITTLKLDVTGDGKADFQMKINGDVTGDSAGWLL